MQSQATAGGEIYPMPGGLRADSSSQHEVRERLVAGGCILIAVGILLIGNAGADPRLVHNGIPVAPFLFFLAIVAIASSTKLRDHLLLAALLLSPLMLVSVTLLWSPNQEYGEFKLFNALLSCLCTMPLILHSFDRLGPQDACRIWVASMAVLLGGALFFKIGNGFFNRDIPFLLNGPIVFARLMGIAAIMSLFCFGGLYRVALTSAFAIAVVWTMSKGPLLALCISFTVYATVFVPREQRVKLILSALALAAIFVSMSWNYLQHLDLGRLSLITSIVSGDVVSNYSQSASTGDRAAMFAATLDYIHSSPGGIGLGGWSAAVFVPGNFDYPHNLVLELWAEGGLILGSVSLVPFFLFFAAPNKMLKSICIFLLLSQMVSGDLLDARFLLAFSLVAAALYIRDRRESAHPTTRL